MNAFLLVIDFPDERIGTRSEFDHMHAWGTKIEMEALARRLRDQFGGNHVVQETALCNRCGARPPRRAC